MSDHDFRIPETSVLSDAEWQIERFVLRFQPQYRSQWEYRPQSPVQRRFYPEYLLLAQYAALPLVITPELLNYLRADFLPKVPWIAEADLLLSDLCRSVGYEQYVLLPEVRSILLAELKREHPQVLPAVARKIINYSRYLAKTNPYLTHREQRRQEWSAMGCIVEERQNLADQIAEAFTQLGTALDSSAMSESVRQEMEHLAGLVREMSVNLQDYPALLAYAELVSRVAREPESIDRLVLQQSFLYGDQELPKLEKLLPLVAPQSDLLFPELTSFEFDVAEFVDTQDLRLELFKFEVAKLTVTETELADVRRIANYVIKSHTRTELTALQDEILEGAWYNLSYAKIAESERLSPGYVSKIGAELFRSLSEELGKWISKKNIKAVFQGSEIHIQRSPGQAYQFVEPLADRVGLEMVQIPAGRFMMGAPAAEAESRDSERPQHLVTVPEFYMGKYPVTQAQWRFGAKLAQIDRTLDRDPSRFNGDNLPVEQVSWLDAIEFCARLSHYTGREYRLPSEAEWEYACRAGTTTPFHFGETIDRQLANYDGNYTYGRGQKGLDRSQTTPVGSFKVANNYGLYDMHGNVWEWCQDRWHEDYHGAPNDGSAWIDPESLETAPKGLRGGSWLTYPRDCRSAIRLNFNAVNRTNHFGFRLVTSAKILR